MGNGIVKITGSTIPLKTFETITTEYDKMKTAGISVEEMHLILIKRMGGLSFDTAPGKEDDNRPASSTITDREPVVSNSEAKSESKLGTNENLQTQSLTPTVIPMNKAAEAEEKADHDNGLVLLIDDSPVAAKVASKVLHLMHFEVLTANSAKKGYDILCARGEEIKIIFLDVVMPQVDGVECLQWIKENADVAHIPVYMLSGLEDQLLQDVCLERGAEGMLLKPLKADVVKQIIHAQNIDVTGINMADTTTTAAAAAGPAAGSSNTHGANGTQYQQNSTSASSAVTTSSLGGESGGEVGRNQPFSRPSNKQQAQLIRRQSVAKEPINQSSISVNSQAPAFKLVDSDFQLYSFPGISKETNVNTYLVFVPTIYCSEMYSETGFMTYLFQHYEKLTAEGDQMVMITGDLPFALAAAKKRFQLPFRMLSDPSLFVAQRYVGSIDIGAILAKPPADSLSSSSGDNQQQSNGTKSPDTAGAEEDFSNHVQNSYLGPNLGIVYLTKHRDVLNKWLSSSESRSVDVPNFNAFPLDILRWSAHAARHAGRHAAAAADTNTSRDSGGGNDAVDEVSAAGAVTGAVKGAAAGSDPPTSMSVSFRGDTSKRISDGSSARSASGRAGAGGGGAGGGGGGLSSKRRTSSRQQQQQSGSSSSMRASTKDEGADTVGFGSASSPTSKMSGSEKHRNKLIESAASAAKAGKKNVLIVDDSSVSSRVACRKLENLGYAVTCVYNGQQGYDILKRSPTTFDIAIVDVVMPVCDGMELLRMCKGDSELEHIPIVMLSGLDGEELSRNCLSLGAADLMQKPFDDNTFAEISNRIFATADATRLSKSIAEEGDEA